MIEVNNQRQLVLIEKDPVWNVRYACRMSYMLRTNEDVAGEEVSFTREYFSCEFKMVGFRSL